MKWLAIVNPRSGGEKHPAELSRIAAALRPLGSPIEVTEYRGHAEQIARQASGVDGFVVAGGDGTLNEVLNGFRNQCQVLALLPAGTGNSLARDLGLLDLTTAVQSLRTGFHQPIDLMRVSFTDGTGQQRTRISASTVALGYPAAVTDTANRRFKALGRFCYPVASAHEVFHRHSFEVRLSCGRDRGEVKQLTGLIVNNTCHVGNFLAFPTACLSDGRLDVMELNGGTVKQLMQNLSILSKSDFYQPAPMYPASSLALNFTSPQDLMIDGEIYPAVASLEIQTLPRALRCVQRATPEA